MQKYDYIGLQNGSDIRGVAIDGVPGEKVTLTDEAASRLVKGFIYWLSEKTGVTASKLTISVGRDPRLSGLDIADSIESTLQHNGVQVLSAGLASTPAMFMSTVFEQFDCDGAIMITASHLPFNRNGLKFFSAEGGLNKGDITDIIIFAESDYILGTMERGNFRDIKKIDLMDVYSAHLRDLIIKGVSGADSPSCNSAASDTPLAGLKITVDAGNGSGGFYASEVLAPLGADISSSQFLQPDGNFPNHAPNPENKEAMASICAKVKESGSDLGLIFDTDVDRSSAVDEHGREIARNSIVAMAAALIADEHPGTTVVTDSITSRQLTEYLEGPLGLKHLRFQRGYRNVINKAIDLNAAGIDSQLAIETSGHAAYKENYFLDDGAYLATKIVIAAAKLKAQGRGISEMISDLEDPAEAMELRFPIKGSDFKAYGDKVLADLDSLVRSGGLAGASLVEPNYEGVRINFTQPEISGWLLLRKSLHDPIMPLNVESDVAGGCEKILAEIKPFLTGFNQLDTSKL